MPRKLPDPASAIPLGCAKPIRKTLRVDLLKVIGLLLTHLTPALCETVFQQQRTIERTRKWTFYAVNVFWAAMIVRHPPSIQHGLDHTRKGRGRDPLWPRVLAAPQAFFQKAQGLRPALFKATYAAFTRSILPKARPGRMPRGWARCARGFPRSSSWTARASMPCVTGSSSCATSGPRSCPAV